MENQIQSSLSTEPQTSPQGLQTTEASDDSNSLTITSSLRLPNNAARIPRLGFGIYLSPPEICAQSCLTALSAGYRHIDSAQYYQNEYQMGDAVRKSGIPRNEVFLTTKILSAAGSADATYRKCLDSVNLIDDGQNGYVDLFLIHSPSPGPAKRREMWGALERLYREGRAKAIGVSNFGVGHVEEMKEWAKVWPPHVNQLELHPWSQQRKIVSYCRAHSIIVQAYSPLVRNQKAQNATLVSLARKYNKTPSQILVRWSLQKGWVPLPKSDTKSRIEENRDVFGWELESGDMQVLDDLDEGEKGAIVEAVNND